MALLGKLPKHVQDPGMNSEREISVDADAVGYSIGEQKAYAMNFLCQNIRVLFYPCGRCGTEGAINSKGQRGPDAVSLQENHDVLHATLLLPCLHNSARANLANAVNLQDAQRFLG